MKPLLISSGEPAGIGPDLCLSLAESNLPLVILGDKNLLENRAKELGLSIQCTDYQEGTPVKAQSGHLTVLSVPCAAPVVTGQLNTKNAGYVIKLLELAASLCQQNIFSGLVTAPVHKAVINASGIPFTGHTEFFAEYFGINKVVMMLACDSMRVALVTTHLPLSEVPQVLTQALLKETITILNQALIQDFAIPTPLIKVAGLNPHAGESGYLGREEIDIIQPVLSELKKQGLRLEGPLPADTLFTQSSCDAYLTMYHDQGLPVLKYAGFNKSVNITLGLPIIRTSVDHGTALDLAGKGLADSGSLFAAVQMAQQMAEHRQRMQRCQISV